MMDKAVILARGLGTRMRKAESAAHLDASQSAIADSGIKAMIPIDRPFLDYVLHALAEAGYRRICLVIGPEHTVVRDYYGQNLKPNRIHITFAVQENPLGPPNAVAAAEQFAAADPFLVINSDNYYPLDALKALRQLDFPGLAGFERTTMLKGSNIPRSEEHTSELQSLAYLVCRLLLEKKRKMHPVASDKPHDLYRTDTP